jgi:hypothetical protein
MDSGRARLSANFLIFFGGKECVDQIFCSADLDPILFLKLRIFLFYFFMYNAYKNIADPRRKSRRTMLTEIVKIDLLLAVSPRKKPVFKTRGWTFPLNYINFAHQCRVKNSGKT